ncbi:hypothetical protein ACJIZ3_018257 [Penstemon smallii]|uniref:Uncharacterized protein n=1 Tax=Penstemon smallii TaxID=265156 RepID=A0ABD3SYB5_9LAMI
MEGRREDKHEEEPSKTKHSLQMNGMSYQAYALPYPWAMMVKSFDTRDRTYNVKRMATNIIDIPRLSEKSSIRFRATKIQKTETGATIRKIKTRDKTHIAAFPGLINPELIRPDCRPG